MGASKKTVLGIIVTLIFLLLLELINRYIPIAHRYLIQDTPSVNIFPGNLNGKPFSFARYYGNNMVLQRAPNHAVIWGYSQNIGERIMVKISETEKIYNGEVVLGPDGVNGVWKVKLDPENRPGPFVISVFSSKTVISINNVLFGDVWLCSGQSNMKFKIARTHNVKKLIEEAALFPYVRLFDVGSMTSIDPLFDIVNVQKEWSVANAVTVHDFSAVCWVYGKSLCKKKGYPIGLISSTFNGSPIEFLSSIEPLKKCGLIDEKYRKDIPWNGSFYSITGYNKMWNGMIHPLLNMSIFGTIWFQGENNRIFNTNQYNCTFPSMIADWRRKFSQAGDTNPLFPFGFVQLSPWKPNSTITTGYPDIRWHQTADYGHVPNAKMPKVFMSVAMDLPDFTSIYGSIHPRIKEEIATRLFLSGLAIAYDEPVDEWHGPLPNLITLQPNSIILNYPCKITTRSVEGFEIYCLTYQGRMGNASKSWLFSPIVSTEQSSIKLQSSCGERKNIVGMRYAWRESPCKLKTCAVYSRIAGLPAPPFFWNKPSTSKPMQFVYSLSWDKPEPIT